MIYLFLSRIIIVFKELKQDWSNGLATEPQNKSPNVDRESITLTLTSDLTLMKPQKPQTKNVQ